MVSNAMHCSDMDPLKRDMVLRPFPSALKRVQLLLHPTVSVPCIIAIMFAILINVFMRNSTFQVAGVLVPYWKVIFVTDGAIIMIMLMSFEVPSEAVLIIGMAVFAVVGIIDPSTTLQGNADPTVTSVALLFVMAKALADTGILNSFVGIVLGTPYNQRDAIFRVCLLTGLLSAMVNNTPCIAMMIPILRLWCRRVGYDVRVFAMPMSFASQMGGNLSLMGAATNFAAKSVFAQFGYAFGFFEMTLPGLVLFGLGLAYSSFMAPRLLGSIQSHTATVRSPAGDLGYADGKFCNELDHGSEASEVYITVPSERSLPFDADEAGAVEPVTLSSDAHAGRAAECSIFPSDLECPRTFARGQVESMIRGDGLYKVAFKVERGEFAGLVIGKCGFERLEGVTLVGQVLRADEPLHPEVRMNIGDRIIFSATAEGLVMLRALPGISLLMELEIRLLGAGRRHRRVFEVELPSYSALLDQRVDVSRFRFSHECALLAVRSHPSHPGDLARNLTLLDTFDGFMLCQGDVLLIEAGQCQAGCRAWARDFGIVRSIPHSAPPRSHRFNDHLRAFGALLGSIIAIVLFVVGQSTTALKPFTLTNNLLLLVGILLVGQNLTLSDVYESLDGAILLTLVGSIPLGQSIQNVGLDAWTAEGIVTTLKPTGRIGLYFAIYVVAAGLSQIVSNVALINLMAPVIAQISALDSDLPMKTMVPLVTIAVNAVFITPIGYQTNQMVVGCGKYSWNDFYRFGIPFQLLHMVLTVFICMALT